MSTQVAALHERAQVSTRANIGRVLCVFVPLVIWFAPFSIEAATKHGLAITSFMIVAWITEAMDYALAGLIGCYLFWALNVVTFSVAFSGFATDTPWFLFGATLFGTMATKSGLARSKARSTRCSSRCRSRCSPRSTPRNFSIRDSSDS